VTLPRTRVALIRAGGCWRNSGSGRAASHRRTSGDADEHIETALAECTRAEANLGSLIRGLTHLTAGARAARDANTSLLRELDSVRELLGKSHAHELMLRHRVQSLEQQLENAEREATLAHGRFIEQEDLFLAQLLTDHERELIDLRRKLVRAEVRNLRALELDLPAEGPEESLIIPREIAERPDSLDELALARAAASPLGPEPAAGEDAPLRTAPISTMPPPPDFHAEGEIEPEPISTIPPPPSYDPFATHLPGKADERRSGIVELAPAATESEPPPSRGPESKPVGALLLKTISVGPGPLIPKRADAQPAPNRTPGILDVALESLPLLFDDEITEVKTVDVPASRPDSKPAIKQKPDPSTRPLVGYSLGSNEVAEEHIDTSRISSRPPNRS
jgi:hypothetical protein